MPVAWRSARVENGLSAVKRSDMAAVELTFQVTPQLLQPDRRSLPQMSRRENAMVCGWIEVLFTADNLFESPPASLRAKRLGADDNSALLAWREDRRLVLPLDARPGTFQTVVGVNLHKDARLGKHQVWTRIVHQRDDTRTPWLPGGEVLLTAD